jgi:beta-mannosidase
MKRYLSKDKEWGSYNNNEWILHAANYTEREDSPMGKRNLLMLSQVRHLFGDSADVSDIDDFICASQITQAEAKKYFIEHFRSRKPHKTGIIWWNMIDGWPQFSDAIVDYYFDKKRAYDCIKRSQTPVCIMIAEHDDKREIVAVNDTLKPARGTWQISTGDAATPTLRGSYEISPNGRTSLGTLKKSRKPAFYTIEWTANGKPGQNHYVDANPPWDFAWYRKHMDNHEWH